MITCQDLVLQEGAGLEDGERSKHAMCPACGGGRNREQSFVVTRHGRFLFFMCYRNSCGVRGKVTPNGPLLSEPRRRPVRRYYGDPVPLPTSSRQWLSRRLHLDERAMFVQGWRQDKVNGRTYMPIFNHTGVQTGCVLRSWIEVPKAITYFEDGYDDAPKIHFPIQNTREGFVPLVLVEDIPSSVRISEFIPCAALMGTHLAPEVVQYLARIGASRLVIALDADAKKKAIDMRNKYRLLFNQIDIMFIEKDVKDMNEKEFKEFIDRVY